MNTFSICTTCKNREYGLSRSLFYWLRLNPTEIVIVDWSSDPPLLDSLCDVMMQNSCIKLAVVKNRCTYDASISRNLGVLLCSTDLIFNMDCDVYIENKYLFQMVLALPRDNTVYRGGQYRVTGSCIMTNRIWWLVGGLSEDYRGSAHIDLDLYTRMAAAGVQYRLLNTGICRHWDHLLIQRDAWIPVKRQDMEQTTIHSRWNRSRLFSRQDVSLLWIEKNELKRKQLVCYEDGPSVRELS